MRSMQTVIDLGRSAREKAGISLKTPVKGITVVCKNEGTLKALEKLQTYVKGELNAWEVRCAQQWAHCDLLFCILAKIVCCYQSQVMQVNVRQDEKSNECRHHVLCLLDVAFAVASRTFHGQLFRSPALNMKYSVGAYFTRSC